MDVMSCQCANDLELARALLIASKGSACIAVRGDEILSDSKAGVDFLLDLINQGRRLYGYSLADKAMGKAGALLCATLGPDAVFAQVMTKEARAVLVSNGIRVSYDALVGKLDEMILGVTPLDSVLGCVFDPYEAVPVIKQQLSAAMA